MAQWRRQKVNKGVVRGIGVPNYSNAIKEQSAMYLQNKYTRWYYNIIQQAQSRILPPDVYVEKHHIIPKSLGGNNTKLNIAKLTPREHFVCHLLLTKMTDGNNMYKMRHAIWMLINVKRIGKGRYTPTGRMYEHIRQCHNIAIKESWTEEKRKQQSETLIKYNTTVDKNSPAYIAKIAKIKQYNKSKIWSEKAIQSRLDNCLKNATARKGKPWTDNKRQSTLNTYLEKNLEIALKIIELHDTGLNKLKVSQQLGISWEKVKYSVLHREDFLAFNAKCR